MIELTSKIHAHHTPHRSLSFSMHTVFLHHVCIIKKICNVKDFKEKKLQLSALRKQQMHFKQKAAFIIIIIVWKGFMGKKKSSVQIIRHSFHDILTAMLVLIKISRRTAHCRWHFIMHSLKSSHSLPQRERSLMRP